MSDLSDFRRRAHDPLQRKCERLEMQNKALVEALNEAQEMLQAWIALSTDAGNVDHDDTRVLVAKIGKLAEESQ